MNDTNIDASQKAKARTLAEQIHSIYQKHPRGISKNPYALPCRVIALMDLLGYASSYNCKSGKDRTGVCSMELTNLIGQLHANNNTLPDPFAQISPEEQRNLQTIYCAGDAAEIVKTNTAGTQKGFTIKEVPIWTSISDRFGTKLIDPFDQNKASLQDKINPPPKQQPSAVNHPSFVNPQRSGTTFRDALAQNKLFQKRQAEANF